jgi:hypothetical protein
MCFHFCERLHVMFDGKVTSFGINAPRGVSECSHIECLSLPFRKDTCLSHTQHKQKITSSTG